MRLLPQLRTPLLVFSVVLEAEAETRVRCSQNYSVAPSYSSTPTSLPQTKESNRTSELRTYQDSERAETTNFPI